MEQAIIVLLVVGFLMIATEVFIPGMVLGILGALCLLAAVGMGYAAFGPLVGTGLFAAVGILTVVGFAVWMRVFTKTPIGKKILLTKDLASGDAVSRPSLVGAEGKALTALRPAGTALIAGARVDVVADVGFIEAESEIAVVLHEGMRIVVQRKD